MEKKSSIRRVLGGHQIAYTNIGKDYTLANAGSREHYTKPAVWVNRRTVNLYITSVLVGQLSIIAIHCEDQSSKGKWSIL